LTYSMLAEPLEGSNVTLDIRVWYQSMPPRWLAPMFDIQDSTIQAFQDLFDAQGAAPELVAETTTTIPVLAGLSESTTSATMQAYPNPTFDGEVAVRVPRQSIGALWEVYSPSGSRIAYGRVTSEAWNLRLPEPTGTYVLRMHADGNTWTRRLVRR